MIKTTITTAFLALFFGTSGQIIPMDPVTDKFKYEEVMRVDSAKKSEIYGRAKDWIVRTLKSSDNVINFDDENRNAINVTGNMLLEDRSAHFKYTNVILNFKFSAYFRDNRCKVIVENFILNYDVLLDQGRTSSRMSALEDGFKKEGFVGASKPTERTQTEVNEKITKMIQEFESAVKSKTLQGDGGNW